ncbi:MAG: sigma-70 family RNA polymerase sigma factor [Myxococcota bacterium]
MAHLPSEALLVDVPPTPAHLVARMAEHGDRDAFAELFARFAPRLAGFFRSAGLSPVVRDELVQEVLLRVWKRAAQYDPKRATVEAWIFAIARNARIDHFRRPASRAHVEPLDPAFVDDTIAHAEDVAVLRQRAEGLRQALDTLPEEQSAILVQAYFHHKTLREIASDAGLALGTVKSRVRLAFARLRTALGSPS